MQTGWVRLKLIAALLFPLICGLNFPASAAALYSWVPLTATGEVNGSPVDLYSLGSIGFASPLAGNHFSFFGMCSGGIPSLCAPGFSTGDFGSFAIFPGIQGGMKPIILVNIDVIFNADGTLTGHTFYNDLGADFFLSGTGNAWGGEFNSDFINCRNPTPCGATGYWQTDTPIPAPEPSTLALVLAGITAAGFAKLRRQKPVIDLR